MWTILLSLGRTSTTAHMQRDVMRQTFGLSVPSTPEVTYMMNVTYADPKPLHVEIVVDPACSFPDVQSGSLGRVPPEEEQHAFILSTARDVAND